MTDVVCYHADAMEFAVLQPIADELQRRGHSISTTDDFSSPSELGLYACHGNRFFDFDTGKWSQLPSDLSVMCTHDLGQSDSGPAYFAEDGWGRFDLGLLPGERAGEMWRRADALGYAHPRHGMVEVGWPPSDVALGADPSFDERVASTRAVLGLDTRPVLLLACSWSDRRQLTDLLAVVDRDEIQVVVRYPASSPPTKSGPWFKRLQAAYDELQRAIELAESTSGVFCTGPELPLPVVLTLADVIVSNGSSVAMEGIVLGRPAMCITSWRHPAGPTGDDLVVPSSDIPAIVVGPADEVPDMLRRALHPSIRPFLEIGRHRLVPTDSLGQASSNAADAIESLVSTMVEPERLRRRVEYLEHRLGELEATLDHDKA